ncbi:MAG: phosphodiester glycosidase family protein, partial [bacterium]|nr:phosphodiester glycosidase family protein [bacterium]
ALRIYFTNNCPVAPLHKYVQRVQGFAGINGTYFCPADYAACTGKTGTYFWMVYNSVRHTFVNASQNKFNRGPLVAFDTENHWHFWREAKDWPGLAAFEAQYQTKLTALISNGPALLVGNQIVVTSTELDTKQRTVKSARSGFAFKGKNVYLIVVNNATVLDLAAVMAYFKMEYGINLDGGGSSSLYYLGKYRVGPGRNIPNALLFSEVLVQ